MVRMASRYSKRQSPIPRAQRVRQKPIPRDRQGALTPRLGSMIPDEGEAGGGNGQNGLPLQQAPIPNPARPKGAPKTNPARPPGSAYATLREYDPRRR